MILKTTKYILLLLIAIQTNSVCQAQLNPINFEATGYGANWTWTTFENDTNPAATVISNPVPGGINTSDKIIEFTALQTGQPWAGFESLHGGGIGTFTLDTTNSIIKVMVYKTVISDVGVKLVTPSAASTGELKVANTLINQWEELTFDFTSQIGHPAMTGIDQIVIFPDFNLGGRTANTISFIDNIIMGTPTPPINVKFEVENTDSIPVYVFGDWNNWSNFPGTPMTLNSVTGRYETTIPLPPNTAIEYQFVNGTSTHEVLDPTWTCTNGNTMFTNRLTNLGSSDTSLCNIWESCNGCSPVGIEEISNNNSEILLGETFFRINNPILNHLDEIEIVDLLGRKIFQSKGKIKTNQNIPVHLNKNTIYIVQLKTSNKIQKIKTTIIN